MEYRNGSVVKLVVLTQVTEFMLPRKAANC
jgi:hypothetical protein